MTTTRARRRTATSPARAHKSPVRTRPVRTAKKQTTNTTASAEAHERLSDDDLDALLPSEGYVVLEPKASVQADTECPSSYVAALFWSPTLQLKLVWPLVLTSISWYGVSSFALACGRRPHADRELFTVLAFTQAIQATCSWMHWLAARSGVRCALDKIFARGSFLLYTAVALVRIRDARLCLIGWPLWLTMVACYRASRVYWELDRHTRQRWVIAHAGFHVCVGVGQCIILHGASVAPRP